MKKITAAFRFCRHFINVSAKQCMEEAVIYIS